MEEKKCKSCSDPKNLLSWWVLFAVYSFGCTVKVTVDLVKYLIELF
jgi:hypothetical protein